MRPTELTLDWRLLSCAERQGRQALFHVYPRTKRQPTLDTIKHDPRNARKHTPRNVGMIESSIQRDGFGRSILLANDGTVIAGNATMDAAASAGLDDLLVIETDGTKVIAVKRTDVAPGSKEFHNLALADNRAAELAEWDPAVLAGLQDEMDLSQFFGDDELAKLLSSVTKDGLTDPDDVPTVTEATTKPGDLWLLGDKHRVMCGSSTNPIDVARLLDGHTPDLLFADPPYGIDVVRSTIGGAKAFGTAAIGGSNIVQANQYKPIAGDLTTDAARDVYVLAVAEGVARVFLWGGNYFTDFLPPSRCWIAWDKKGREWDDNFSDFELAWTNLDQPTKMFRHTWMGMVQQGEREKRVHPTQKPVQLTVDILTYLGNDKTIYDPFLGSGTTLIAAEQLNRTCYGMEIDPHYCDVIVKRWEQFAGQQATLEQHAMAAD
jgi:hypothetical protein